jgi:hypothetical protein
MHGFGRRWCGLAVGEAIACNGPSPTTPVRRQGSTAVKEQGSTAGAGDEVPRARGGTNGGDPLDPGRGRVRSSPAARLAARPRRARRHRRRRTTRGRIDGVGSGSGAGGPVLELALTWTLRRSSRRPPPSLALPPRGPGGILGGRRAGVGLTLDDSASELVELRAVPGKGYGRRTPVAAWDVDGYRDHDAPLLACPASPRRCFSSLRRGAPRARPRTCRRASPAPLYGSRHSPSPRRRADARAL